MNGRAEVHRLTTRLDATFARIDGLDAGDIELRADFARYLCILVTGYVESTLAELILEYCRQTSAPPISRYVESNLRRFTNPNAQRVATLLGKFRKEWRERFEDYVVDERKAALDSVLNLRNQVAHGGSVGVTFGRISDYYKQVKKVVEFVAELCDPSGFGAEDE